MAAANGTSGCDGGFAGEAGSGAESLLFLALSGGPHHYGASKRICGNTAIAGCSASELLSVSQAYPATRLSLHKYKQTGWGPRTA